MAFIFCQHIPDFSIICPDGFYHLFEYAAETGVVDALEVSFRRDEKIMRFLTTALDKHAVVYNARRKAGEFNKKTEKLLINMET